MALAGIGLVQQPVGRAADLEVRRDIPFCRQASGRQVLVVIVLARDEVLAEAVAIHHREGAADTENVAQRDRGGDDRLALVVAAEGDAGIQLRIVAQAARDIFHRAADGVAAIERALGPAQHLDALDIEDIQHGGLRTVEIHIVEIDADARLEAGHRVLLADAANKGGQRGIRATRDFQRDVRRDLADLCQVVDAEIVEDEGDEGDE